MKLKDDIQEKPDIFQQAVSLAKENQRLAKEREQAEERILSLAKFPSENPNPILRIGLDKNLLYVNPPAFPLLNNKLLNGETANTGDQVPLEFQKMASHAFSSQSIQQSEVKVGKQTFHLEWVPILNEGYVNVYGRDITERKKVEEKLKWATRHKELILNSVGEGIYGLDLDGNTTFANPAAEKMLGYKEEELLGKPQHALIHHSNLDGSSYPREDCHIYAAFRDGKRHRESEEIFWRKDGTSFPVEYVSTPILENEKIVGAVVTFTDISKRKEAEQALVESEARSNAVLNHAIEGIITIDEQGTIHSLNPAAEEIFGYKQSEVLKTNIKFLMPEPFQTEHDQYLKNYLETGVSKIIGIGREVIGLRKDGSTFPMDLGVTEMRMGESRMFTGIVRDITERRNAEAQSQLQFELSRILLDSKSLGKTIPKVLQAMGEFMKWEIGLYWENNSEAEELNCRYSWNADCLNDNEAFKEFKKISFQKAFKKGTGLPGRVWEKLEPSWIPDVRNDKNFPRAPFAKKLDMKVGFGFPVFSKNQFIGMIEIFTRQLCLPDTSHIRLMTSLGGQIGQWVRLIKAEGPLKKLNSKNLE
jgi:PAS domain S-box-containing protein